MAQISLHICAVWLESSLIACAFYSLRAIQRGINKISCHTGWVYRLICVFIGHIGLIVGFIVCWLKYSPDTPSYLELYRPLGTIHTSNPWCVDFKEMCIITWVQIGLGMYKMVFLILHENILRGYSLEAPRQGASNEHHNIYFHVELNIRAQLFKASLA